MASQPIKGAVKSVRPLLSTNNFEAKRRVLNLYKKWLEQIPIIIYEYELPITHELAKEKVKNEFLKHKDVTDIRIIDMLVIKGEMELKEYANRFKQKCQTMYSLKQSEPPKPKDFISKFLSGLD